MEKIYEILEKLHPENNYRESNNYIEDGLLDSFDVITLIDELENEFGIMIDGMDIVPENFASAKDIFKMINR